MTKDVSMIGIHSEELLWIRTLVQLLRHPDPTVPELTRQALVYMSQAAGRNAVYTRVPPPPPRTESWDYAG